MKRKRQQKQKHIHFCIFVNKRATNYSRRFVKRLTDKIRNAGGYFTIFDPDSPGGMVVTSQQAVGLREWQRNAPHNFVRRGEVTALIAVGGDGTFNLIARAAYKSVLPIGILPMGRDNNIAKSIMGTDDPGEAVKIIMKRNYQKIDVARVGKQLFFGSAGIGFIPALAEHLQNTKLPRFSIGWSRMGSKVVEKVNTHKATVKIDSFRFDMPVYMININLLPFTAGLELSPASIADDRKAELIIDMNSDKKIFSSYLKHLKKGNYYYGSEIKLFRGQDISLESVWKSKLYLDGELFDINEDKLEVKFTDYPLKVYSL